MFQIALFEPRIAPNTGNIIRLIANNGCCLHLIEPLGFDLEEKKLRRAGLDYADLSKVYRHKDYDEFRHAIGDVRVFACTTKGSRPHDQIQYQEGDVLLFGSETAGLPEQVLASFPLENRLRIPMLPTSRSMNLSNAVAVVSFEAWRQLGFVGGL
jgi:tRNA (cytidine/uridine-2'-O-)-methyltransferase